MPVSCDVRCVMREVLTRRYGDDMMRYNHEIASRVPRAMINGVLVLGDLMKSTTTNTVGGCGGDCIEEGE
jgi:hypothetical protein